MKEEKNLTWILKALDWAYDTSLNGAGVIDSAFNLANHYLHQFDDPERAINNLINTQTAKCATSGFVTGLGGWLTLPVTVPANVSSVLFMQFRMIAAIAIMRGYDPKCHQVKSLAFVCLTGSLAADFLKGIGIRIGEKITQDILHRITSQVIAQLNRKVGVQLLSKTGSRSVVYFSKALPIVGGVVGGAVDASSTKLIGTTAKKMFVH